MCGLFLQANNLLVNVSGEPRVASPGQELTNHVDLVEFLDIVDTKRGRVFTLATLSISHFVFLCFWVSF